MILLFIVYYMLNSMENIFSLFPSKIASGFVIIFEKVEASERLSGLHTELVSRKIKICAGLLDSRENACFVIMTVHCMCN